MGTGDCDVLGSLDVTTYSERAIVGIVFEGLSVKDIQKLNIKDASYEIKTQR